MSEKSVYRLSWLILCVIAVTVAAMVFTPVWLIQPFAAQTERNVEISFLLRSWSPSLTLAAALVSIALAGFIWINSTRWFGKIFLIVPLFIIFVFTFQVRIT